MDIAGQRIDTTECEMLKLFFCALKSKDYMRVSSCKTGKKIWDPMCTTYERTNEQSHMNMLLYDYELFRILLYESIPDMCTRFTKIITSLHALGREFFNSEKVSKILYYLSEYWDAKVTTIFKSKDFSTYSIDNLLSSLILFTNCSQTKDHAKKFGCK